MMTVFEQTINRGTAVLNLALSARQLDLYQGYQLFLIQENGKFNLTSIVQPAHVAEKHFLDALLIAEQMEALDAGAHLIDIGSGAGFPGLPLKIYRPDLNVVLLEAAAKKVNFLRQTIALLQLTGVEAIHARAEDLAKTQREYYHGAVSRAVAEMRVLTEYALPLVRVGGVFIAYKGPRMGEELKMARRAIQLLGGEVADVRETQLPLSRDPRTIITVKKIKPTPEKYPRAAGTAKRKPL